MRSMQIAKEKRTSKQQGKTKQQGNAKKKGVLPFNKQLLDLQKKIQQVEDKNEKILQQIHKAYNFKKKEVYYQAPQEYGQDEHSQYRHQDGQQYVVQGAQQYRVGKVPMYYMTNKFSTNSPMHQSRNSSGSPSGSSSQREPYPSHNGRGGASGSLSQREPYYQSQQPQFEEPYPRMIMSQNQQLLSQLQELKQLQERQSMPYQQHMNRSQRQQSYPLNQDRQSHGQVQLRSSSIYSDAQKRRRINQLVNRRQNDYSDIRSSIEERRMISQRNGLQPSNKHPHKRSFVYKDVQNNSMYSEGHIPSRQHFQPGSFQIIQVPVTTNYIPAKRLLQHRIPYPQPLKLISPRQNLVIHSTRQVYQPQSVKIASKHRVYPVSHQYSGSVQGKNASYEQSTGMSQSEVKFLQEMFKSQRQKALNLEQQVQSKDEKIISLKKYKKSFKNFINTTYYVIQEAFDQYVEYFLKDRLYQLQRLVRKNQNRLSALSANIKDLKEERIFHQSLKRHLQSKGKRTYHSNQNNYERQATRKWQDLGQNLPEQNNLHQNRSVVISRSRQRSISATRRRDSRDKSITKKSSQSQLMKKQFKSIADKYEAMLKLKSQQIEKLELQLKQNKQAVRTVEDQNLKLRQNAQLTDNAEQTGSEAQSRKNTGNLRILSRSSSKCQLKRNSNLAEENEQLSQKIRKYQKQLGQMSEQRCSAEELLQQVRIQNQKYQAQAEQLHERISVYEAKHSQIKHEQNFRFEEQKNKLSRSLDQSQQTNLELNREIQTIRQELKQKARRVSQLQAGVCLKEEEIKKLQNLLELKSFKLQELNKLILSPSQLQNLNDSVSSITQQPQNKHTLILLQNLQRKLEDQKQQKQLQLLKLKKYYQSQIQHLTIQSQETALQNQRLEQKLRQQGEREKQLNDEKQQMQETVQSLKDEIQALSKQLAYLNEKVGFYQTERQAGKTGSFGNITKKTSSVQPQQQSQNYFDYVRQAPHPQNDASNLPDKQIQSTKGNVNFLTGWNDAFEQVQLLDQSTLAGTSNFQRNPPTEQNPASGRREQNIMPPSISVIKDQNIELSQKVAKLQKQNNFLKQAEKYQAQKVQNLKSQIYNYSKKYQELQSYNEELLRMVQNLEREKNLIQQDLKQSHGAFDKKQVQKHKGPVDLRESGMIDAQKEDLLLDKSQRDFNIGSSLITNSNQNRPSQESVLRKVEQLTKRLAETQVILQNKQNMNEELIIGFTKKIDNLNVQIEQQGKVIQKYIQQNSKLRKEKEKLEEEIQTSRSENLHLRQNSKQVESRNEEGELLDNFAVEQYKSPADQLYNRQAQSEQSDGLGLMQQRIEVQEFGLQPSRQSPYKARGRSLAMFQPMLQQQASLEQLQQKQQKIQLLQKQVEQLQQTVEQLQTYLHQTLSKVKQKEEEKLSIVQELKAKTEEVDELKDLIELKEAGTNPNLTLSKSISQGYHERPSVNRSDRPRMNSVMSLKYSQTNHADWIRKESYDQEINFDFLDNIQNNSVTLSHSNVSAMYSDNMSMIFDKEENFLDQIKKAKNKRKQQRKLLKKTFQYIKKLRATINYKNKRVKILENRLQELKDNCWLWKKDGEPMRGQPHGGGSYVQKPEQDGMRRQGQKEQISNMQVEQNQIFFKEDKEKLVDSRIFECNSEDLNKKKPHRHNHYKKLQFDTKLIIEQNKILTKHIQMLQQQLVKIEQQQNGLMAVKQIYKQEIRALNRQNLELTNSFQQQLQKYQQKIQNQESIQNFEAVKQLFKKIIDNIAIVLYPSVFGDPKKKNINQLKQQKRKQAEECVKVICSILNYDQNVRNQLCSKLTGAK